MFAQMQPAATIEQKFVDELATLYDANEARQLYFLLLEDRLGWSKREYLLHKRELLDDGKISDLLYALDSLKNAEPIQYILGHCWFVDMKLAVNRSVLIPRPETEELVQLIRSQWQGARDTPKMHIIDIGTGSGCIALALKKTLPQANVLALDVSGEALRVAKQNAECQSLHVDFICADILDWEMVFQPDQLFDVVVSNPPYITDDERGDMHPNVLVHEPHLALFVDNTAPLLFYEHIAAFALQHLRSGGHLYFEINRHYGSNVCELLIKKGFTDVHLHQDMQGADRMVHAQRK